MLYYIKMHIYCKKYNFSSKGDSMNDLFCITDIYSADILNEVKPTVISNDSWEILYVCDGEIGITADSQVFKLQKGMVALHKPLENRSVWLTDEQTKYISVTFGCKNYSNSDNNVFILSGYTVALAQRLCELIENKNDSSIEFIKTLELILICILNEQPINETMKGADIKIFADAVASMNEKTAEQLSVEVLAEILGVSLSKLKRTFAQYALIGVHEYFLGLKVNYAKQLLAQGESVTRVSELAGFNNQNYFSSSFKRVTGISPKDYISVPKKRNQITVSKPKEKHQRDLPSYLL